MKYNLTDDEIQDLADKFRELIEVKYKDEIGDVPEHIKNSLCQSYVIQCKNNNVDIDKLLDDVGIE